MKKVNFIALAMLALPIFFSCTNDDDTEPEVVEEVETILVEDLYAPSSARDENGQPTGETPPFVYFSLETNEIIDSEEGDWDIAFKSTEIIVNGGVSGSGNVKGTLLTNTIFEELVSIPEDLELKVDSEESHAIPTGMQNGWFNYDFTTHYVTPKAAVVLVFQTSAGNYVKMEILSFFKGNPPAEEYNIADMYHYTFRYTIQPDGTRTF